MKKSKRSDGLMRVIMTLIGMLFLYAALSTAALGLIGTKDTGFITSVTRHGGERNDYKPGRYNYSMGYTFTTDEGEKMTGFSAWVGDSTYVKASGNSIIPVRYFTWAPFINAIEADAKLSLRQPLFFGIGVFLIWAVNQKSTFKTK